MGLGNPEEGLKLVELRRIVASINYYPNYIYANQRLELLAIYYLTPLYPLQPTLRSGNLPTPSFDSSADGRGVRVATRPILDECKRSERKRGAIPRQWWWEQPMDLEVDATGSED